MISFSYAAPDVVFHLDAYVLALTEGPKPTIPDIMPLLEAFAEAPGNSMGGCLHIVLEDGNTENEHVQWCVDHAIEKGDELGAAVAKVMLAMSRTQRRKLCRIWENLA